MTLFSIVITEPLDSGRERWIRTRVGDCTEEEARKTADELAGRWPGLKYVVHRICPVTYKEIAEVYRVEPGKGGK